MMDSKDEEKARSDSARRNLDDLVYVVRNHPIIDNHAHNLLRSTDLRKHPFESITTEAHGDALKDTYKSLSHIRAMRQLTELYECDKSDWESITSARNEWLRERELDLTRKCLHGTHTILMDDGLDADTVEPYPWHDQFTMSRTKRILRIETIAEDIIRTTVKEQGDPIETWQESPRAQSLLRHFESVFMGEILKAIVDDNVVGFKSVICYRTGLDVHLGSNDDPRSASPLPAFQTYLRDCSRTKSFRLNHKPLNDWVLSIALEGIRSSATKKIKPIQFHTGLGDNDMNLEKSNPAHLQPLIEAFPEVPIVLLHSSYPYTQEAGYLATVFSHVYLDVGEIFPMISRDGQMSVLRQSLELVPGNKLLYSTDGHWFPETYWLANKQFREVLEKVLVEYVVAEDLTISQAIDLAKDIIFNNSNRIYKLGIDPGSALDRADVFVTPKDSPNDTPSIESTTSSSNSYDIVTFNGFMVKQPSTSLVYVQWLDYMATLRARMVPIAQFCELVKQGNRMGISRGNTGTLQNDTITPAVNTTGQIYVEPDLSSMRLTHGQEQIPFGRADSSDVSATVLSFWRDADGHPISECPRNGLVETITALKTFYNITLTIGFEMEVTFLKRDHTTPLTYIPITTNHAWGTLTSEQWIYMPLFNTMTAALARTGIHIQYFHAESGPGQFEFVLPPLAPLAACDTLIQARQIIQQIAHLHELRATFHPTAVPGAGTGAHAHISLSSHATPAQTESFWGGVLAHLRAICAFSLPEQASYGRIKDDVWAGGRWVGWGTQNRECPLRRVDPGNRWEVKCLDGMANVYFAIRAIAAAGLLGLKSGEGLGRWKDCLHNPAHLSPAERAEYGILEQLPGDLVAALNALRADVELKGVLGEKLVNDFVAMKETEMGMLNEMEEADRHAWLIERY